MINDDEWLIKSRAGYFSLDTTMKHGIEDAFIFSNNSKQEIQGLAKNIMNLKKNYGWEAVSLKDEVQGKEQEIFIVIDGVRYRHGKYISIDKAIKLSLNGFLIEKITDNTITVFRPHEIPDVFTKEQILSTEWRTLRKNNDFEAEI